MKLDDVELWLRTDGLELLLIAFGAVLVMRFIRWIARRYEARLDRTRWQPNDQAQSPGESARQARALLQAGTWLAAGIIAFSAGILVIDRLGVPISGFVASATVAGVAFGFGAQRVVQDLLAGFFLLTERQFGFGDIVQISDVGATTGVAGTVEEVTLRTTRLRTIEGDLVIVSNGDIRQVTNRSREWSRVVVDIPLPADVDIEAVTATLEEVADALAVDADWAPLLLERPSVWGVESLRVGYLLMRMTTRTRPAAQWDVARELRKRTAEALRAAGVSPIAVLVPPT